MPAYIKKEQSSPDAPSFTYKLIYQALLPPPNIRDKAHITSAITPITKITPVQTPPLKIPPANSQLVRLRVTRKINM